MAVHPSDGDLEQIPSGLPGPPHASYRCIQASSMGTMRRGYPIEAKPHVVAVQISAETRHLPCSYVENSTHAAYDLNSAPNGQHLEILGTQSVQKMAETVQRRAILLALVGQTQQSPFSHTETV